MSADQKQPRSSLAVWLIVTAVMLPVGYVLSVGPVVWIRGCGYVSPATCELIELPYYPLAWLRDNFEPFARALDWYVRLWQ